jgi:hypothetical protein
MFIAIASLHLLLTMPNQRWRSMLSIALFKYRLSTVQFKFVFDSALSPYCSNGHPLIVSLLHVS